MRLTVILIQQPPPSATGLVEELVGNLIGRPGLDLTLVDRIDSIREGSTDQITLESISGDVAVLDWQSPEEVVSALKSLGFEGDRTPHQCDRGAQQNELERKRRIFAFDLREHNVPSKVLDELVRLRASLGVKTFSLGGLRPIAKPVESTVAVEVESTQSNSNRQSSDPLSDDQLDKLIDGLDHL